MSTHSHSGDGDGGGARGGRRRRAPAPEAGGPCGIDFGKVPPHLLDDIKADGDCLRCGHPVFEHDITAAPTAGAASAADAGGKIVVVNGSAGTKTAEEKKLSALTLARAMVRSVRSSYAHDFVAPGRIHLALAIRAANALHNGPLACPSLVVGQLPERIVKDAILKPWERMRAFAFVADAWLHAIIAARHRAAALRRATIAAAARQAAASAPASPPANASAATAEAAAGASAGATSTAPPGRARDGASASASASATTPATARTTATSVGPVAASARTAGRPVVRPAIRRDAVFADAAAGAPMFIAEAHLPEYERLLSALAIGLRATATRDEHEFARKHAKVRERLVHPIVGAIIPFIFARAASLDDLEAAMLAMRDGLPLPAAPTLDRLTAQASAADVLTMLTTGIAVQSSPVAPTADARTASGATSAAAAASGTTGDGGAPTTASSSYGAAIDIEEFARRFPWVGIGEAVVTDFGGPARAVAMQAWEALGAQETLAAQSSKALGGEGKVGSDGSDDGEGLGAGGGGGGGGRGRRRARSGSVAGAAGAGAGAGGANASGAEGGAGARKKRNKAERERISAVVAAQVASQVAALTAGAGAAAGGGAGGGGGRLPTSPGGGGGGGTPSAKAAARARVAAKAVGDITKQDCLEAVLCFKCKHPRHPASTSCDLRGTQF